MKLHFTFYLSLGYVLKAAFERLLWSSPLITSENGSVWFIISRNIDKTLDLKIRSQEGGDNVFKQQSWTMPFSFAWTFQKEIFLLFLTVPSGCCRLTQHPEVATILSHLPSFYISFQRCHKSMLSAIGIVTLLSTCKFHNRWKQVDVCSSLIQYGRWKNGVEVVSAGEGELLWVLRKWSMCLSITAVNNAGPHGPHADVTTVFVTCSREIIIHWLFVFTISCK